MDEKRAKMIKGRLNATADDLEKIFNAGRLGLLARWMNKNTVLILLKSRRVIRGPKAIIRKLKSLPIVEVKFFPRENPPVPAAALLAEVPGSGLYFGYDMVKYLFGIIVFASPTATIVVELMHREACPTRITEIVISDC